MAADIFDFERAAYHRSLDWLERAFEELKAEVAEVRSLLEDAGYEIQDTLSDSPPNDG